MAETKVAAGSTALSEAVARNLFKLMAVKDEYEVARLYTDGSFQRQLDGQFQGYERLEFHLAPPLLGREGPDGKARKTTFGPWMMKAISRAGDDPARAWHAARRVRLFRGAAHGRRLLADYEADLDLILRSLEAGKIEAAAALASIPAMIRGYGHVKQASVVKAAGERKRLVERLRRAPSKKSCCGLPSNQAVPFGAS